MFAKRLTDFDVRCLREKRSQGASLNELANEYNISLSTAGVLARGKRRKEAGGPIIEDWRFLPRSDDIDVKSIRQKRNQGASLKELANEYGKSVSMISRLIHGNRRIGAGGPIFRVDRRRKI